jgi:T-complex protein 1 subunit alpha
VFRVLVLICGAGIDDLCLKLFVEAGAMAVRRVKREDMRRVSRATGATMISSLSNLEGEEIFEASSLGFAEEVTQERIGDDECILVKGTKAHTSASIILRGSNGNLPPSKSASHSLFMGMSRECRWCVDSVDGRLSTR